MIEVPLTKGMTAWVEDCDVWVLDYSWCANWTGTRWYACRRVNGKTLLMHRAIMEARQSILVDHVNGDGLDNRRENLRLCSKSENMRNRRGVNRNNKSGYLGVAWDAVNKKWEARIQLLRRMYFVGRFDDKIEAAKARDRKALELHGEFASLNFPVLKAKVL